MYNYCPYRKLCGGIFCITLYITNVQVILCRCVRHCKWGKKQFRNDYVWVIIYIVIPDNKQDGKFADQDTKRILIKKKNASAISAWRWELFIIIITQLAALISDATWQQFMMQDDKLKKILIKHTIICNFIQLRKISATKRPWETICNNILVSC